MKHMYIMGASLIEKLRSSDMHLVLPHLYNKVPGYLESYRRLSERGDFIMQDNSIFELRDAMSNLVDLAFEVGANEIVVPEVLRDSQASLEKMQQFFDEVERSSSLQPYCFAAVVQGKSFEELASHYRELSMHSMVDTICIAFDYEFDAFGDVDEQKLHDGWNRFSIVYRLVKEKIWDSNKQHHLLGLFNPAELAQYHKVFGSVVMSSIRSNDSSSVFWHSLHGMKFDLKYGYLYRKIRSHVDFEADYDKMEQENLFILNRECMQKWICGQGGEALTNKYVNYARMYGVTLPIPRPGVH